MVNLCGRMTNQMSEISSEFGEAQKFSYRSLQVATNNFSNHNFIGEDAFAKLYRGVLPNRTLIAVRNYKSERKDYMLLEYMTLFPHIVEVLSGIRHPNTDRIIGYCVEKDHSLLVSEYLSNGSLHDLLCNTEKRESVFNWPMRVAVCNGIAHALYHLHQQTNPCIIHRDIKPANILLDSNFTPKIIGFDLAKFVYEFDELPIEDIIVGTSVLMDPEYMVSGKFTPKVDVYGFGMVMLQIISGRKEVQHNNGKVILLSTWALDLLANDRVLEVVDPVLAEFPIDQVLGFMDVAYSCIEAESRLRPSMGEVIQMLNGVCNSPRTTFETQPNTPYFSAASSFRSSAEGVNEGESSTVEGESNTKTQLQAQGEVEEAAETSVVHNSAINITQRQGMGITVSGSGDLAERLSQAMVFKRSSVRQGEFAAYARKKNMMPRNKA